MSQGTAETLVKKDQEDGDFHPLVGQAIGVTPAVTLEQAVGPHLAQVVAALVQAIAGRSQGIGGEDGLVNLGSTPSRPIECRRAAEPPLSGACACRES